MSQYLAAFYDGAPLPSMSEISVDNTTICVLSSQPSEATNLAYWLPYNNQRYLIVTEIYDDQTTVSSSHYQLTSVPHFAVCLTYETQDQIEQHVNSILLPDGTRMRNAEDGVITVVDLRANSYWYVQCNSPGLVRTM